MNGFHMLQLIMFRNLYLFIIREYLPFPITLYTCRTLTELTLRNVLLFTETLKFLSVKTLTLLYVEFKAENIINPISITFPLLEKLRIRYGRLADSVLQISAPNLEFLHLHRFKGKLDVSSTVLKKIKYSGDEAPEISLSATTCLCGATFKIRKPWWYESGVADRAIKNSVALPDTVKLSLMGYYLQFLAKDADLFSHMTGFSWSVKHLELEMCPTKNQFLVVIYLLRKYLDLETLRIVIKSNCMYKYRFDLVESHGSENLSNDGILKNLRTVEITLFEGSDSELDLVGYLLQYGSKMEILSITFSKDERWRRDMQKTRRICMQIRSFTKLLPLLDY